MSKPICLAICGSAIFIKSGIGYFLMCLSPMFEQIAEKLSFNPVPAILAIEYVVGVGLMIWAIVLASKKQSTRKDIERNETN